MSDSDNEDIFSNKNTNYYKKLYKQGQQLILGDQFDQKSNYRKTLFGFLRILQLYLENDKLNLEDEKSIKYFIECTFIELKNFYISTEC